jgi:hypothetical protein
MPHAVVMALRKFDSKESSQRAMDALELAMKKLREQTHMRRKK